MRKILVFAVVLVCVIAASFLIVLPVERKAVSPDGSTPLSAASRPTQVEVTNFPSVQPVSGTVNVGNLPAVQNVSGTVQVSNLPLDGSGRVVVAVQNAGSGALVLHTTVATYQGDLGGRTGATQKCQAEFPGSHFVHQREIGSAQETGRGIVWLTDESRASWVDDLATLPTCGHWHFTTIPDGTPSHGMVIGSTGGTEQFPPPPYANSTVCTESLPLLCAE
jgi:hypothetical protein